MRRKPPHSRPAIGSPNSGADQRRDAEAADDQDQLVPAVLPHHDRVRAAGRARSRSVVAPVVLVEDPEDVRPPEAALDVVRIPVLVDVAVVTRWPDDQPEDRVLRRHGAEERVEDLHRPARTRSSCARRSGGSRRRSRCRPAGTSPAAAAASRARSRRARCTAAVPTMPMSGVRVRKADGHPILGASARAAAWTRVRWHCGVAPCAARDGTSAAVAAPSGRWSAIWSEPPAADACHARCSSAAACSRTVVSSTSHSGRGCRVSRPSQQRQRLGGRRALGEHRLGQEQAVGGLGGVERERAPQRRHAALAVDPAAQQRHAAASRV